MFKKLRNKLLITNMIIITAFVTVCLGGIQILVCNSIRSDVQRRLDANIDMSRGLFMREFPDDVQREPHGGRIPNSNKPDNKTRDMSVEESYQNRFASDISVYCDSAGNVIKVKQLLDSDMDYSSKLPAIATSDKNEGEVKLDSVSWTYKRVEFGRGYIVAFTRSDWETRMILTVGFLLSAAALASLGISFAISRLTADRAIRPVEEAYEKQRRFVADASHELRTPLASISANLDVLLPKADSTIGEEMKWLEYIKDETVRMTQLTNDLLYLARADADSEAEKRIFPTVSFSEICDDIMIENEAIAFENNINLQYSIEEAVYITAPPASLKQLVLILLDNALKYTPGGGKIEATLKRDGGKAVFSIENDGQISSEDLPHLFERFYRADKSRARESGGYGLGLAIAQSICESLRGKIKAESENGKTRFTIMINIAKE